MTKQRIVGFLIVAFIACLFSFGLWIKGNPFQRTYEIKIRFPNVHGLHKGSVVEYEGFRCGEVTGFEIVDHGIVVMARIDEPNVKLYQSDRFIVIPNSTIASEYQIYIERGLRPAPEYKPGHLLVGETPPGFQDYLYSAKEAVDHLNNSLISLKSILEKTNTAMDKIDPVITDIEKLGREGSLYQTVKDIQSTAKQANALITANHDNINNITANLNTISTDLNHKLKLIKDADVIADMEALKTSLQNLKKLSSAITPQDVKNITETINETKNVLAKVQSDNPDKDLPTLIMRNAERIDNITYTLEKNMANRSLFSVLFQKMPVQSKTINSPSKSKQNTLSDKVKNTDKPVSPNKTQ